MYIWHVPWVALHDKCNKLILKARGPIWEANRCILEPESETLRACYFVNNSHKVHEAQEAGLPSTVSGFYSRGTSPWKALSSESFGYHPRSGQEGHQKSGMGYRRRTLLKTILNTHN